MFFHYPALPQQEEQVSQRTSSNHCQWCLQVLGGGVGDFLESTSTLYNLSLLRTTLPLQTIWFSISFGSYGILTWINSLFVEVHLENPYTNALLFAISNLPGNLVAAFFMDYAGRTCMLVTASLSAATSLMAFAYFASQALKQTAADQDSLITIGIVISACSFQAFSIVAWNTIDCLTTERFPTSVRSTGMGVCTASGRIGAMLAQFVNGSLVNNPVRLLLVASTSLLISAMAPFLLPLGGHADRALDDNVQDLSICANYVDAETTPLNETGSGLDDLDGVRIKGYQHGGAKRKQIL
ncbi:sugar transporter [Fragilaria crotonensis]|nr:sugar transporter [Fragilaria crotonensis]